MGTPKMKYMTVRQAADHFGRSTACVRWWLQRGTLRGVQPTGGGPWRIPGEAVESFMVSNDAPPPPPGRRFRRASAARVAAARDDGLRELKRARY